MTKTFKIKKINFTIILDIYLVNKRDNTIQWHNDILDIIYRLFDYTKYRYEVKITISQIRVGWIRVWIWDRGGTNTILLIRNIINRNLIFKIYIRWVGGIICLFLVDWNPFLERCIQELKNFLFYLIESERIIVLSLYSFDIRNRWYVWIC